MNDTDLCPLSFVLYSKRRNWPASIILHPSHNTKWKRWERLLENIWWRPDLYGLLYLSLFRIDTQFTDVVLLKGTAALNAVCLEGWRMPLRVWQYKWRFILQLASIHLREVTHLSKRFFPGLLLSQVFLWAYEIGIALRSVPSLSRNHKTCQRKNGGSTHWCQTLRVYKPQISRATRRDRPSVTCQREDVRALLYESNPATREFLFTMQFFLYWFEAKLRLMRSSSCWNVWVQSQSGCQKARNF